MRVAALERACSSQPPIYPAHAPHCLASQAAAPPSNPVSDWFSESCWASVAALREIEEYTHLPEDLVGGRRVGRGWALLVCGGVGMQLLLALLLLACACSLGSACANSFTSHTCPPQVSSSKRWREWMELERPEDEPLPGGPAVLWAWQPPWHARTFTMHCRPAFKHETLFSTLNKAAHCG